MDYKKFMDKLTEQAVAEGLGKTIKRSIAGWGAFDKDKPADVVKRVRGQNTDTLKGLSNRGSTGKGSPAELQQKAIERELKKRGEQGVAEGLDIIARADYKLDKAGKKSHKEIVFHNGSVDQEKDDKLKREEVELEEKLDPSMGAGAYIKDFQKSDAPQFKGKSKEKKRMMGIAAYMAAKKGMKEEVDIQEAESHQSKTTMKHIPNASPALKKAAKDIKPGVSGYRDRVAMLKAGGVKEETVAEAKDEQEYGYEGDMAMTQLETAIRHATHLKDMMQPDTDLPEWVQSKITLATDYLQTACDYMTSEMNEALKGNQHKIDKNKNGKVDAHDFKLLRKEELDEALDPSEIAGNPKMYDAATAKKAYYHKSASASDKESLARHLDRHHGNTEWRKAVKEEAELTEGYDKKSKAHALAARLTSNSKTAKAEYHSDGSASIHHKPLPTVSSATQADAAIKKAGGEHNNSEADLKNHKQIIGDLKIHVKKTNSGHTTHISESILEAIDEAMINGREYASHGLMHPDHAAHAVHKVTGSSIDFYAHGTGDKVEGKVTKNDGKAVHIKDTKGTTHKFKVQRGLPKQQNEELELEEAVVSGNKGNGYHGQHDSEVADKKYSAMHSKVKAVAGAAGHMKDVKKPNVMVKHYLDSKHGRHLAGNENDSYIKSDFDKFKRTYKPELHEELEEQAPVAPSLMKHRISVTVSDPDHTMVSKRKEKMQKTVVVTHSDNKEGAQKVGEKFYKKKGYIVHDSHHAGMVKEEVVNAETIQFDEEGNLMAEKKTYSQFVEQLLEYESDKEGVYRHTKGSYGKSYDSEDDDKPSKAEPSAVKRGRGRPAGAKSGANQKVSSGKSYGGIATHTLNLPK